MNRLEEIINKEYEILKEMLKLSEEQKNSLVKFDVNLAERTTSSLLELSKELKNYENERINYLVNEVKLSRKQAYTVKLTELADIVPISDDIMNKKEEMRQMIEKLAGLNSLNKLLANRALSSINEILSSLSNSSSSVCNVRV